jgi:hypothetical protein
MKVTWDDDIPNIWKNKKCFKPPTSYIDVSTRSQYHSKKNIMAEIGIELHSYFKLQEATPKHQAYIKQILTWWLGFYSFS